jgi:hypothetical protein
MAFLRGAISNTKKGKVARFTGLPSDQMADRPSGDQALGELVADIEGLLKEAAAGFPLLAHFRAILNGINSDRQRATFGPAPQR